MQDSMSARKALNAAYTQAGLTLVEVLMSVSLMVLIAGYFVSQRIEAVKVQKAESIAQELMTVAAISTSLYINAKAWPDQDGNCAGLLAALQAADVFPPGLSSFSGLAFSSDCSDSSPAAVAGFGQILRLTISFPYVDREYASLVASMISASNLVVPAPTSATPDPNVTVEHYLFPPRKHTLPPFQLVDLNPGGRFRVDKPKCGSASGVSPQLMLIPQAVCVLDDTGLGGFYFFIRGESTEHWEMELRVSGSNPRNYVAMSHQCDGNDVQIGVITYCGD